MELAVLPSGAACLRHCNADPGLIPGCVAAGYDRETYVVMHIWLGEGLAGMPLSHCDLATPVAGRAHAR
jgi:hypothetical protein